MFAALNKLRNEIVAFTMLIFFISIFTLNLIEQEKKTMEQVIYII